MTNEIAQEGQRREIESLFCLKTLWLDFRGDLFGFYSVTHYQIPMKRPDWSPFFVRIVLLLAWSGLALSGWAQELRLLGISTDSFGRPHIRHTSRTNYYYLLLSGRSLGDVQSPGGPVNSATVRELELGRDRKSVV